MTNHTLIQPAHSKADLNSIESLAKDIWEEHYIPIIGAEQVKYMLEKYQSVPAMKNQIQEGYEYYKIVWQGILAGYFSIVKKENSLFLSKLYVQKDYRGKGLGREALVYIGSLAFKKKCNNISLTVNKDNTGTVKAYKKLGFKNVRSQVIDIGNGFVMDDYVMEKSLN